MFKFLRMINIYTSKVAVCSVQTFGRLKSTIDSGIFKALQKACAEIVNSKEGDE